MGCLQKFVMRLKFHSKSKGKHASLFTFIKLFQIFGIDISSSNKDRNKTNLASVAKNIMRLSWIVQLILLISKAVVNCGSCKRFKISFVKLIVSLGSFLMWCYIIKYQTKLKKIMRKLQKMEKLLEMSNPQTLIVFCYVFFVSSICIWAMYLYVYHYNSPQTKDIVQMLTFDRLNTRNIHWSVTFICWHTYYFQKFCAFSFTCYFALFCIIVFYYMMIMLSRHVEINKSIKKHRFETRRHCDVCFIRYDSILTIFKSINFILSFPLFLDSSYTTCQILLPLLRLWNSQHLLSGNYFLDIYFFTINFILFTGTIFAAYSVNEADKKAKESNIDALQLLSNRDRKHVKESNGDEKVC